MAWRLAISLVTLRNEVNAFAPGRSKVSDGTIGDPAHAARASRHNPNRHGVVTALDLTHDPVGGYDAHGHADRQRVKQAEGVGHPELAYIVSNRRIASLIDRWAWRVYTGSNPHSQHVHWAVGVGPDSRPEPPYDSTQAWGVAPVVVTPPPPIDTTPFPEDDDMAVEYLFRDARYKDVFLVSAEGAQPVSGTVKEGLVAKGVPSFEEAHDPSLNAILRKLGVGRESLTAV